MKKFLFVLLVAFCGVSFSFADSYIDCVVDCARSSSPSVSNLIRKQKAVDDTECIDDCESALQNPEYQKEYSRQQTKNIYDPEGESLGPETMVR